MKEWSRIRGILIVMSLVVAGAVFLALTRSALVSEARRGRDVADRILLIQRNEERLRRIEALERVYREEILPSRDRMIRNRQRLAELVGALSPELGAAVPNRDRGGLWSGADSEGGAAWARFRDVLPEAIHDPLFWNRECPAGQDEGQAGGCLKPSSNLGNGHVQ